MKNSKEFRTAIYHSIFVPCFLELQEKKKNTDRFEITTKLGYVNPEIPYQSLGFQTAFSYHNQESYFGLNLYDIQHTSFYSNLVYNSIISDSRHKIKTGLSFTYDSYSELVNIDQFDRIENSFGGFFESDV